MQERKKILAVDDNSANLMIITELLDDQYELMTVSTGQDALKRAQEFQPDLILLDVMMAGIDGYEVCRRIRMTPSIWNTKIIIVSAKAMVSERLKGYRAGADDYFTKPFDGEELLAKVRVYLRMKSVREIEQIENDTLRALYHKIKGPLDTLTESAQTLVSDKDMDTDERNSFTEKISLSAEQLQGIFDEIEPVGTDEELKVEAQAVVS